MANYTIIGIDLAKRKLHLAALDAEGNVVLRQSVKREVLWFELDKLFLTPHRFAFEACSGCHVMAQQLMARGHSVELLKPRDVKAFAKSRQKNDINDAIAICRAALDPTLMRITPKTQQQQEIAFIHHQRDKVIQQRIQWSNAIQHALSEFGYDVIDCKKATFCQECEVYVEQAFNAGCLSELVYTELKENCQQITALLMREAALDKRIKELNRQSKRAKRLLTIPGVGPLNASYLTTKSVEQYASANDFSASIGLVPSQHTTGGHIRLGGISKQGDRYLRRMLIQGGRCVVMRCFKPNCPQDPLYEFAQHLLRQGKHFNVVAVAVANKIARIAYRCLISEVEYSATYGGQAA